MQEGQLLRKWLLAALMSPRGVNLQICFSEVHPLVEDKQQLLPLKRSFNGLSKAIRGASSQEASKAKAELDEKEKAASCHPGKPGEAGSASCHCWSLGYNYSLKNASRHQRSCIVSLGVAAEYRGASQWGQVGQV